MYKPILIEIQENSSIGKPVDELMHVPNNYFSYHVVKCYDIILIDTEIEIIEDDKFKYFESNNSLIKKVIPNNLLVKTPGKYYKIISSTNKSYDVSQLSLQSIQLLINYYNEHKYMIENIEIEEEFNYSSTGKRDNGLGEYAIKLNHQGEVDITISEVEKSLIDKLYNVIEAELDFFNSMNPLNKMSMMEILNQLNSKKK